MTTIYGPIIYWKKMEGRSEFKGMDDNSEFIYRSVYFFLNDLL